MAEARIPEALRGAAMRNAAALVQSAVNSLAAAERELVGLGFDARGPMMKDPAAAVDAAKISAENALYVLSKSE